MAQRIVDVAARPNVRVSAGPVTDTQGSFSSRRAHAGIEPIAAAISTPYAGLA